MIKFGTSEIGTIKFGNSIVSKVYFGNDLKYESFRPSSGIVYTLSSDGTYYIVGTGFTTLSAIKNTTSGGTAGSGVNSQWSGGELNIPSKYNGKPVLGIAPSAFSGIKNITKVNIQDGITHIGNRCFQCTSAQGVDTTMTSLKLPKSITFLCGAGGGRLCWNRKGLTDVYFDVPDTSNLTGYSTSMFYNAGTNCKLTIGKDVVKIGTAFAAQSGNLFNISQLIFETPSSLREINSGAFWYNNCSGNIDLPSGLTKLSYQSLPNGGNIYPSGVTIPSTVTDIGGKLTRGNSLNYANVYATFSATKATSSSTAWFPIVDTGIMTQLVIHIPSSVTNPSNTYGSYWNYGTNNKYYNYIADL